MRRWLGSPWLAPMALMALLGVFRIDRPALWADELATAGAARLSWAELWRLLANVDLVLAPYYAFMHIWTRVAGDSETALRVPSLLAMLGAVGLTAAIGARLRDTRTGLIAGLLLAVTPTASRFAQEARPYAATLLFAALASLLLVPRSPAATGSHTSRPPAATAAPASRPPEALSSPASRPPGATAAPASQPPAATGSHTSRPPAATAAPASPPPAGARPRLVPYSLSVAALGLAHPLGLLILPAHLVFAWRQRWWRGWLWAAGLGALPGVLLLGLAHAQRAQISWIKLVTWPVAIDTPGRVAGAAAVGGALLVLGLVAPIDRLILPWAVVPVATLLLTGIFVPVWVARYVLFALPAWALLAALALRRLRPLSSLAIVALIGAMGLPAQQGARQAAGHGEASRQIAAIIGGDYRPGDVAVYADSHRSIPWAPRDIVTRYLQRDRTPRDALALTGQRVGGRLLARECVDIAACLGTPPRVWLIRVDNPTDPLAALASPKGDYLRAHFRAVRAWRLPLLTVVLLVPR